MNHELTFVIPSRPSCLVGLLCASAELGRLPAVPWPLEAAVEELGDRLPVGSRFALLLDQVRPSRRGVLGHREGIREALWELVRLGYLRPEGKGRDAGFEVIGDGRSFLMLVQSPSERRAIRGVGKRLADRVHILSKKATASGDSRASTI